MHFRLHILPTFQTLAPRLVVWGLCPPNNYVAIGNFWSVGKKEKGEGKEEGGKGEGKKRGEGRKKEGKGKGKKRKRERRKKGEEGGRKRKKGRERGLLLSAIFILGSSFNWPLMYMICLHCCFCMQWPLSISSSYQLPYGGVMP